jgi:Cdc6-like AAA superfamily ATPase
MYKHIINQSIKPIIIIEGSRTVGKTYLINSIEKHFKSYKYPFVDWFNTIYDNDMSNNTNKEIFYLIFGQDTCLFDLYFKGLIEGPLILDRGFLSNAVFGIQSNRIQLNEVITNLKWQLNKWPNLFKIVYIDSEPIIDIRNKDNWSLYDNEKTKEIYQTLFKELNLKVTNFYNNKDKQSITDFYNCIKKIS